MSPLFLLCFVFVDVCGRTAHVSQIEREAEYRHWQNVVLLLHGVG